VTGPVPPRYGQSSLGDLLPGVVSALTGEPAGPDPLPLAPELAGVRRVAVLLVDGLGYHQLPVAAPYAPVLADVLAGRLGRLTPLTSGFPSTTPVSLVSLGTGVPPGEHGVLGFTVNIPGSSRVLNHIDWAGDPDPGRWQPVPTQFDRARAAGVAATVVSRPEFAGSGLTVSAYRGADYRGGAGTELAGQMLAALDRPGPCLVYGYEPAMDRAGHLTGVDSEPWRAAARDVDRLLRSLLDGLPADAALLVTADHGQLNVAPEGRFDIDSDARLAAGVRVVAGEPRVRYLHVEPGAEADVLATWGELLGGAAWVAPREEVVAAGWFGPVPAAHLPRIGDIVVACRGTHAVLATAHEPAAVAALVGFHGSFTPAEMIIPLIVLRRP
jgi:Type I phosphodiesterase / nucleotide pyrophosphatase